MSNQNDQNQANKNSTGQHGGAGSDAAKKTGQQSGQHQAESSRTGQQGANNPGGSNPGRNDDDRMNNAGKADKSTHADKGSHQK
jgi:hypothetical protein